jgi:hypothetical protein
MNTTTQIPKTEEEMKSLLFKNGFDVDSSDLRTAGIIIGIDTADTAYKRMVRLAVQRGIDIGESS